MEENKQIGFAKKKIEAGDTIAFIELGTLEVSSDVIKFIPHGKNKLRKKVLGR